MAAPLAAADTATAVPALAWSADDRPDDIAVPRSWRALCRNAIGVFAVCVAVAGTVVVVDQHWPRETTVAAQSWPGIPPVPAAMLPSPQPPAPQPDPDPAARSKVYAASPAAEHLRPPAPAVDPNADAMFLTGLQRTGSMITDVPAAIASGHSACIDLAHGHTSAEVAAAVMSHNQTLSAVNALGMVYSAVAAYCPEYTGR